MICDGKRFEYHLIIALWDSKKNSILDAQKIITFIKKNYLKELFEDDIYNLDSGNVVLKGNLIVVINGKWLRLEKVESAALKISDKFHTDIILTMTDDDGCAHGDQIFWKPKEKKE